MGKFHPEKLSRSQQFVANLIRDSWQRRWMMENRAIESQENNRQHGANPPKSKCVRLPPFGMAAWLGKPSIFAIERARDCVASFDPKP